MFAGCSEYLVNNRFVLRRDRGSLLPSFLLTFCLLAGSLFTRGLFCFSFFFCDLCLAFLLGLNSLCLKLSLTLALYLLLSDAITFRLLAFSLFARRLFCLSFLFCDPCLAFLLFVHTLCFKLCLALALCLLALSFFFSDTFSFCLFTRSFFTCCLLYFCFLLGDLCLALLLSLNSLCLKLCLALALSLLALSFFFSDAFPLCLLAFGFFARCLLPRSFSLLDLRLSRKLRLNFLFPDPFLAGLRLCSGFISFRSLIDRRRHGLVRCRTLHFGRRRYGRSYRRNRRGRGNFNGFYFLYLNARFLNDRFLLRLLGFFAERLHPIHDLILNTRLLLGIRGNRADPDGQRICFAFIFDLDMGIGDLDYFSALYHIADGKNMAVNKRNGILFIHHHPFNSDGYRRVAFGAALDQRGYCDQQQE